MSGVLFCFGNETNNKNILESLEKGTSTTAKEVNTEDLVVHSTHLSPRELGNCD